MMYVEEVPISVSINEAVELAKAFGGEDDSPRFVNGVLGRIARNIDNSQSEETLPVQEINETSIEDAPEVE